MIVNILISILGLFLIVTFCYKKYKKSQDGLEKSLYILGIFVYIIPVIMFYLDRYNIPTILGWGKNVNTQNWLAFLASYSSGVVSAIIGAIVLVIVTILQIKKNNEDNAKRDSENLRIQNMPMLKYEIKTVNEENKKIDIEKLVMTNCDDKLSTTYNLFVTIKNIGLNNVKRIIVDFESPLVKNIDRIVGKKNIIPMEKNESKNIYTYFDLEIGKEYLIKLNVYYEDVLQNWYYQTVNIYYEASKVHNGTYPIGIVDYQVNEETSIDVNKILKEK